MIQINFNTRIAILAVFTLFFTAVTLPIQAQSKQEMKKYISERLQEKMAELEHVPATVITKILGQLKLDKNQRSRLSAFFKRIKRDPEVVNMQTDFRNKMMSAVRSGDMKKVDQLIDELAAKKDKIYKKTQEGIHNVLTEEQRAKMKELIDDVKKKMAERKK